MRRAIIVDLSNIRENAPGKAKFDCRDHKNPSRKITLAEWGYIYDGIQSLVSKAPGTAICLIADMSLKHHFVNRDQGMRIFEFNQKLPIEDIFRFYAMPSKRDIDKWSGLNSGDNGVRADDLILYLAAQLDGFVVSGDFFRDEQYQENLQAINHRVFWPARSIDESDWLFVDQKAIREIRKEDRFNKIPNLPCIEDSLISLPLLSQEEILEIRESVFDTGGLIDRFWLEYKHSLTKRTPNFGKPKIATRTSATRSLLDVFKENIGILPPSDDGLNDEEKVSVTLACFRDDLTRNLNRYVRVIGRVRKNERTYYIEWFPGDCCVKLDDEPFSHIGTPGDFVGIIGRLDQQSDKFTLRVSKDAEIRVYPFTEILEIASNGSFASESYQTRQWNFPRLPGWRQSAEIEADESKILDFVTLPGKRTQFRKTLVAPPREPTLLNRRLVTSISISALTVAAAIWSLFQLLL